MDDKARASTMALNKAIGVLDRLTPGHVSFELSNKRITETIYRAIDIIESKEVQRVLHLDYDKIGLHRTESAVGYFKKEGFSRKLEEFNDAFAVFKASVDPKFPSFMDVPLDAVSKLKGLLMSYRVMYGQVVMETLEDALILGVLSSHEVAYVANALYLSEITPAEVVAKFNDGVHMGIVISDEGVMTSYKVLNLNRALYDALNLPASTRPIVPQLLELSQLLCDDVTAMSKLLARYAK